MIYIAIIILQIYIKNVKFNSINNFFRLINENNIKYVFLKTEYEVDKYVKNSYI